MFRKLKGHCPNSNIGLQSLIMAKNTSSKEMLSRLSDDGEILPYPLTNELNDELNNLSLDEVEPRAYLQELLSEADKYIEAAQLRPKQERETIITFIAMMAFVLLPLIAANRLPVTDTLYILGAAYMAAVFLTFTHQLLKQQERHSQTNTQFYKAKKAIPGYAQLLDIEASALKEEDLDLFAAQLMAWKTQQSELAETHLGELSESLSTQNYLEQLKETALSKKT